MSLTQQLVLHASLDRFEEVASGSNRGWTVWWRTPGSSNLANAMWMGLLCQVEERWNVYGAFVCLHKFRLCYILYSSSLANGILQWILSSRIPHEYMNQVHDTCQEYLPESRWITSSARSCPSVIIGAVSQ